MLKKKNQFFYIMLVLCAGYTVSQFLRTSIGVLSPNLMIGFNINPNDMGLLGGVFFLSFALFQIPAGILIDQYSWHAAFILPGIISLLIGIGLAWHIQSNQISLKNIVRQKQRIF